jgi:glycosyltransferase involved in cell wall biosynthesis
MKRMGEKELPMFFKTLEQQLTTETKDVLKDIDLSKIGFGSIIAKPDVDDKNKLKFMLVGTHTHQFTGYSKVTYNMIQELSKKPWLKVTHFGFQKMPEVPPNYRPYPANVEVYDAAGNEKPQQQGFGYGQLAEFIRRKEPDVVFIYNDLSVVTRFLEEIRKSGIPRTFKIWIYCDQVYNTQLQQYLDVLNRDADLVFAFSSGWKKCLKEQGINRPIDVITHGFDKEKFVRMPRELARKQMNLPNDRFIILNLNRNQPRKRYDIMIMSFVELIAKYPTKPIYLFCVCDKGEKGGWDLFGIFKRELLLRNLTIDQFADRLMVSSVDMKFRDEDINLFYNVANIGINTADGEGWGLCNFEQMGVGVPQVVPDIGGYKEFCTTSNSVLVKPTVRYYLPMVYCPVGGEAIACTPHDMCLGMEEYLLNSSKLEEHGKAAYETVQKYTWPNCLANLVKRLQREKEDNDAEKENN